MVFLQLVPGRQRGVAAGKALFKWGAGRFVLVRYVLGCVVTARHSGKYLYISGEYCYNNNI